MRRFVASLCLTCVVLASLSGCVGLTKEAVVAQHTGTRAVVLDRPFGQSSAEHLHSLQAVVDQDAKAIVEDWDLLWQRDRPTRLTRWHER